MNVIDQVFIAVLGRYRRRSTFDLESSWRAADHQVATYLAAPVSTVVLFLFFIFLPNHRAVSTNQRYVVILGTIVAVLLMGYGLNRRFRRFLTDPPPLESMESTAEARLVLLFRLVTIGILVVGLVIFGISGTRLDE